MKFDVAEKGEKEEFKAVEVKEEIKEEVKKEEKMKTGKPRSSSASPIPPEEDTVDAIEWLSGIAQRKKAEKEAAVAAAAAAETAAEHAAAADDALPERRRIDPSKSVFMPPTIALRQVNLLECSCGLRPGDRDPPNRHRVQCNTCGMLQHAECVGYDLADPARGPYQCPHCWSSRACPPCLSAATLIVSPATICYQVVGR